MKNEIPMATFSTNKFLSTQQKSTNKAAIFLKNVKALRPRQSFGHKPCTYQHPSGHRVLKYFEITSIINHLNFDKIPNKVWVSFK